MHGAGGGKAIGARVATAARVGRHAFAQHRCLPVRASDVSASAQMHESALMHAATSATAHRKCVPAVAAYRRAPGTPRKANAYGVLAADLSGHARPNEGVR